MKLLRDKTKQDTYMCQKVLNMLKRSELRVDHPLQRRPAQWDVATKNGFIATVVKMEDCDSIKICEQLTENGVILWLIDGLQRVTTLNGYKNNLFAISNNVEFPIVEYQVAQIDEEGKYIRNEDGELLYEVVSFDLRGKKYKDLPDNLKENFDNYPINVVKHLDCTDEQIGYHIRRYNHQTSMNASQNAVTFMNNTAKYVKAISDKHRFFKDYCDFSENKRKKGVVEKVISEAMMGIFCFDKWKKATKAIGIYLNQNVGKTEFNKFSEYLDRLEGIATDEIKTLFTEKNALIWFMLFDKFTKLNVPDFNFGNFMDAFIHNLHSKMVGEDSFDTLNENRSTKDRWIIEAKLNLLYTLLCDYLDLTEDEQAKVIDEDTQKYIDEFCESDLMELTDLTEEDKQDVALKSLEVTEYNSDDALLYSESAKDWLLEVKDYDKLPLKYAIPSVIGFVDWVYRKDYTDNQGIKWLNQYVQDNHFTYDIKRNLDGLITQCASA